MQRLAALHGGSMAIERDGSGSARIVCRLPLRRALGEQLATHGSGIAAQ